ncbi:MAG: hypothetical protein AAGI22_00905 [Planctomycetota bacterium]
MREPLRRAALPAFLLALPIGPAAAQEVAWTFEYDSPIHGTQAPLALHDTPDGGVLSVFAGARTGGGQEFVAVKFSANGDRDWGYEGPLEQGAPDSFWLTSRTDSAVDADGNLYLVSGTPQGGRLIKVDAAGQEAWRTLLPHGAPNTTFHPEFVAIDGAGFPVVAGTTTEGTLPHVTLVRVDPAGAILWRERSEVGGVHDFHVGPNGELVVLGQTDVEPWQHFGLVQAFGPDGTSLWRFQPGSDGTGTLGFGTFWFDAVVQGAIDPSGRVYGMLEGVYGAFGAEVPGFEIVAYDPGGAQSYSARTDVLGETVSAAAFAVDDAGRVAVVGRGAVSTGGGQRSFTVWHVDASGTVDWISTPSVAQGVGGSGGSVAFRPDGRVIVRGQRVATPAYVEAEFLPDGTEVSASLHTLDEATEMAFDGRGNLFRQTRVTFSNTRIEKLVDGGPVGAAYCGPAAANSTGFGARLRAIGSSAASDDNITVVAELLPSSTFVLFLASQGQGSVPGAGGGQGTLCLGGAIGRYVGPQQIRRATTGGFASLQIDLDEMPSPTGFVQATSGSTWNLQAWYRDANPGPTSNLTDAVSILLQ